MTCTKLAKPVGPFSLGKIVKTADGVWGYSSGQLGLT